MTKKSIQSTKSETESTKSVIARSDDGTIQITFTIPYANIKEAQLEVAKELGDNFEVPGFRKGKAPVDKVIKHIPQNKLLEKALSKILPNLFSEAIKDYKIKPAVYPKFELITAKEGKDWQIRGFTCEIPEVELGDYKAKISGAARAKSIWTPGKGIDEKKKDHSGGKQTKTKEKKEQEVIKILLDEIKIKVPKILIDDEVNSRLSRLLERLEKLGLTLEDYLSSIGKTPQSLRGEYEEQAKQGISLDLILSKIAEVENIKFEEKDIDNAIKASSTDPKLSEKLDTPEQRRLIASILKRRKVLDNLTSLV